MWLTTTKGIEQTEAVRIAMPPLEGLVGEKLDVHEVMELVLPGLHNLQKPLPDGDWKLVDWQKRRGELSLYVPKLYFNAVDRIGKAELERRREEKKKKIDEFMVKQREACSKGRQEYIEKTRELQMRDYGFTWDPITGRLD